MPLLEAEPRTFPDTLLSDPSSFAAREGCWWVLYTRSRMEKALARQLRAQEIPFYLPLYQHTWKANGRKRTSFLPLFPGWYLSHRYDAIRRTLAHLLGSGLPLYTNCREGW